MIESIVIFRSYVLICSPVDQGVIDENTKTLVVEKEFNELEMVYEEKIKQKTPFVLNLETYRTCFNKEIPAKKEIQLVEELKDNLSLDYLNNLWMTDLIGKTQDDGYKHIEAEISTFPKEHELTFFNSFKSYSCSVVFTTIYTNSELKTNDGEWVIQIIKDTYKGKRQQT